MEQVEAQTDGPGSGHWTREWVSQVSGCLVEAEPAWGGCVFKDLWEGRSVRSQPEDIKHEDEIVWTEDVSSFDYVRETLVDGVGTRRRPVSWRGQAGRRVGYALLKSNAPSDRDAPGMFTRRVFWVKEHDRSEQPDGAYSSGAPSEAVDPRTVAPRVCGELTERAWGGPLDASPPKERAAAKQSQSARPSRVAAEASSPEAPAAVEQGVKEAFADWLRFRDVSVPETLGAAAEEAFSRWLWGNSKELTEAIAAAIAKRVSLAETPSPAAAEVPREQK
ncbi:MULTISPECIES: DUF6009 family protein [Streptomyces]|uniref:DUF6009 family protein n=1 Tax=Streptomyces caviscabies TaxID=90079 RepID=A0ABW2MIC2_9ACTN|nr:MULTISPECIES: DUF6009 family protein [unclassified Streptomyces]